ncbi:MAG: hypothetical protein ACYCVB_16695 [Bacilli bacterium]
MYVALLISLGILALAYSFATGAKRGNTREQADVLEAVEAFVSQMEAENDRVIELIASLRNKFDSQQLIAERTLQSVNDAVMELADRVARLETVRSSPSVRGAGWKSATQAPDQLSGKYREVAVRLLEGQEREQIMRDLDIGQGEIDLVTRVLENGSASS